MLNLGLYVYLLSRLSYFPSVYPHFQNKTSPTKPLIEVSGDGTVSKSSINKRQHSKTSTSSLDSHLQANDSPTNRRLTPVLTITLPSTEELRSDQQLVRSNSKPPPSPQTEEKHAKISTASAPATTVPFKSHQGANGSCDHVATEEALNKCDQYKRQVRRMETSTGEMRIFDYCS